MLVFAAGGQISSRGGSEIPSRWPGDQVERWKGDQVARQKGGQVSQEGIAITLRSFCSLSIYNKSMHTFVIIYDKSMHTFDTRFVAIAIRSEVKGIYL